MQHQRQTEIEALGRKLNIFLQCPITYGGEPQFWCKHKIKIPILKLLENSNWEWVKEEHDKWLKR